MLYHCGLLDEQPEKSRTLEWVMRPAWGRLPADVERELRIFLAMPGFSTKFIAHVFRRGVDYVRPHMGRYEDWKAEVAENWLSTTREDCIRLTKMRPGTGNVPVICQLRAIQDVKDGMTCAEVAREYGLSDGPVRLWVRGGIRCQTPLPSGFSLLGV